MIGGAITITGAGAGALSIADPTFRYLADGRTAPRVTGGGAMVTGRLHAYGKTFGGVTGGYRTGGVTDAVTFATPGANLPDPFAMPRMNLGGSFFGR